MSEICNETIYSIKVQSCWTSEKRSSVNELKGFKGNQKHFSETRGWYSLPRGNNIYGE